MNDLHTYHNSQVYIYMKVRAKFVFSGLHIKFHKAVNIQHGQDP